MYIQTVVFNNSRDKTDGDSINLERTESVIEDQPSIDTQMEREIIVD